jgi:hypothetical protein
MKTEQETLNAPSNEEISTYAYYLWESDGRQPGHDLDYWLQAKAHLIADRQYLAGATSRAQVDTRLEQPKVAEPSINDGLPAEKVSRKRRQENGRPANTRQSALV